MRYKTVEYRKLKTETKHEQSIRDIKNMVVNGWEVEAIDGRIPLAFCETCGLPLFGDDDYQRDDEGIFWHTECPEAQPLPDLLPCPFCGGPAALAQRITTCGDDPHEVEYYGQCVSCHANHDSTFGGYPDELTAAEKWNNRTAH